MNTLEKLACANKENYITYLNRMSQSCENSSKHLIPFYTLGCSIILDVGCADGTLIKSIQKVNPTARVIGIDINENAVKIAQADGLEVYHMALEDVKKELNITFDCIVFSSVLHEIYSYADKEKQYAFVDIIDETLVEANELLSQNGKIIIRDGLESNECKSGNGCKLYFYENSEFKWFGRFLKEFKFYYSRSVDLQYQKNLQNNINNIRCTERLAQEFLATYTWGEQSWSREIQETFCFNTEEQWQRRIKNAGFEITSFFKSQEDYPKYLKNKVKLVEIMSPYPHYEEREFFPFMTCTIIAKKK